VRLALGTDSLASNADLDMRREMALARAATPSLSPELVWTMATTGAARALGLEGRVGSLHRGSAGDVVAHDVPAGSRRAILEALTTAHGTVERVWVAGEQVVRNGELEVGGGRRV
jgi:5-methylthioadenosine/S-adenosylhomocysteine deaminase